MRRPLAEAVALGLVCLLTGWLATLTGQPPALDLAAWPPAGLGLAAVMARGRHMLAGVWGGHAVTILLVAGRYFPHATAADAAAIAAVTATGAAGSAALGAWLVRALVGHPARLVHLRDIVVFLLVVGPLAPVVSAAGGVAAACALDGRAWADWATHARAWWLPDVAGGVVFAPVGLAVFGRPRAVWAPRLRTVAAPVLVACLATAVAYTHAHEWDEAPARAQLEKGVEEVADDVEADFRRTAGELVAMRDALAQAGLSPTDPAAAGLVRDHLRTIRRTSRGVQGVAVVRAGSAVVVAVDAAGGPLVEGLDLAADPAWRAAAEATTAPAAVRLPALFPLAEQFVGVLALPPAAGSGGRPAGYLVAVVGRAGSLSHSHPETLAGVTLTLTPPGVAPPAGGDWRVTRPVGLGQLPWAIHGAAGPGFVAAHRTRYAALAAWVGAALRLLLVALLLAVTGQTALVAERVSARTAELRDEVAAREFTEAWLRASEARLAEAQRIAKLGYWEWDVAADQAYWSAELTALLGVSAPPTGGGVQDLYDWVHPGDRAALEAAVGQAVACRGPVHPEFRVLCPDGEVRWLAATVTAVSRPAGPKVRGTVLDITVQKRAEAALRESEERFRRVFEDSPIGIYRTTPAGDFLMANPALVRMSGYPSFAVLAAHNLERDCPHVDYPRAAFRRLMEEAGEVRGLEAVWHKPDGTTVHIRENARAVRGPDGGVLYYDGTIEDITAARQAALALRESEARLAEAQRIARIGSWEWDLATNEVWWSAELFALLGRPATRDPLPFEVVESWMHPDDRDRVRAAVERAVAAGGAAPDFEARFVHPTGEARWYRAVCQLSYDAAGRPWLKGVTQDITDRKRTEDEKRKFEANLQQTQRLESLGILAGGIAHDFNNLLTGMLGNASLARELIPAESELHEFLRPIEKSAEHAAQLCQQMLAYAGKGGTVRGPLSVNELIRDSSDLVRLAASRKAALRIDLGDDLQPVVGDASQLRQVLLNLVQNASEAIGPAGGSITVRTGDGDSRPDALADATWSGDVPPGRYVWLEVADTGCGMPPATRARIFEPFFTTKFTGRGLGLSAVHGIVKGHGGALCVTSTPGRGTTFRVYLPTGTEVVGSGATECRDADNLTQTPSPRRVALLADDEPVVRELAGVALRSLGFAVEEAVNGAEAVELFHANPDRYALAMFDVMMPEMDGREALALVRGLRPELPVVMMSGYSDYDLEDLLTGPNLRFLPKPFRPADLTSCVRRVVGASQHSLATSHYG